jgi:hypothetical protein
MAGVGSKYAMPWIAQPGEHGKCRICKCPWGQGWWVRFGSKGVCHANCYLRPEFRGCTAERPQTTLPWERAERKKTRGKRSLTADDAYVAERARRFWSFPVTRPPPERPLPF